MSEITDFSSNLVEKFCLQKISAESQKIREIDSNVECFIFDSVKIPKGCYTYFLKGCYSCNGKNENCDSFACFKNGYFFYNNDF